MKKRTNETDVCVMGGCDNPKYARGFCKKHYLRLWRRGDFGSSSKIKRVKEWESPSILKRALKRAKEMFSVSRDLEKRVYWRREIVALREELKEVMAGNE